MANIVDEACLVDLRLVVSVILLDLGNGGEHWVDVKRATHGRRSLGYWKATSACCFWVSLLGQPTLGVRHHGGLAISIGLRLELQDHLGSRFLCGSPQRSCLVSMFLGPCLLFLVHSPLVFFLLYIMALGYGCWTHGTGA